MVETENVNSRMISPTQLFVYSANTVIDQPLQTQCSALFDNAKPDHRPHEDTICILITGQHSLGAGKSRNDKGQVLTKEGSFVYIKQRIPTGGTPQRSLEDVTF